MSGSSKRTIFNILFLYLGTSAIFLGLGFYQINKKETENILYMQVANLRDISFEIHDSMRKNKHDTQKALKEILENIHVPFAIYDKKENLIFSNLSKLPTKDEENNGIYRVKDKVIVNPDMIPHHRDRKPNKKLPYTIFIEDNNVDSEIIFMRLKLVSVFLVIFIVIGIVAYSLVRLFLKPIQEQIKTLDMFIKDTTHEINTPLSVILMSIETLKTSNFAQEDQKKIERIKLASMQINQIYNTLVASNFPHSLQNEEKRFWLDDVIKERLDFFNPFFLQKKLSITSELEKVEFYGSKDKWIIVIDNLLSNAIKYNHKGGAIEVKLTHHNLIIKDSGCGINTKNLDRIYERYSRLSEYSGGFGIGLSLVKKICDEYRIVIDVESMQEGTTFILRFSKDSNIQA